LTEDKLSHPGCHKDVQCLICETWFIISDPKIYEIDDGIDGHTPYKGICKKCWIKIGEGTSWIDFFREKIKIPIYEYEKVKIPAKLRWQVWKRDNFTCQKCGARENLTVDHIKPESSGGPLDLENSQTLCRRCNSSKGIKVSEA